MAGFAIQQIKERLDIVEVISGYLKLEKTGINFRARCPFHSEKKPSFFVSPARQMFKCFGCGASGSIFDFVMKIEGVEFGDALRVLARRAGVELKAYHPELQTKRQRLYEITEIACRFFEKQLQESFAGKEAKDYLLKRGLKEETVKKWRLGYSPESWRALSDFLVGKGYKREEIVEAGLAVESERAQTPYDRFRGRLIFPVFDLNSQVVGFGARVKEGQKSKGKNQKAEEEVVAKYINTPNTPLYEKSRILYGLNFAKMEIRKKDACILTEGYMDVILSHQAGFENTVATSGTALTHFQLNILKRYTSNLLIAFDMDFAGDVATKRGIDLAQEQDFEIKIISMPSEKDPADIIVEEPKKWGEAIEKAQEIMSFYFESALAKHDKETPKGKKEIAALLLPVIKRLPSKILQSHWAQKLAGILRVSEEAIFDEMKKLLGENLLKDLPLQENTSVFPQPNQEKSRQTLLEEKIFSLLLLEPKHLEGFEDDLLDCFSPQIKTVLVSCKKEKLPDKESMAKFVANFERKKEEVGEILENSILRAEMEEMPQNVEQEIKLCLIQLKELHKRNKLEELEKAIQAAEADGNMEKVRDLMEQFNQLIKIKN